MRDGAHAIALPPDTVRTEREAYLRRLRAEPAFLMRHVPTLAAAVLRRARTQLSVRLSRPHRGSKLRPPWLDGAGSRVAAPRPATGPLALPTYAPAPGVCAAPSAPAGPVASSDPEDYLAAHRWGALTDALLAGGSAWQQQLAACVQWLEDHGDRTEPAWEPYSACERVANLLVFLAVMHTAPRAPAIPPELRAFLQESMTWILRHLEYYGPAQTNNHIINNARAVVMAAVALDDGRARATGVELLRRCLPGLILEGGFLRERSSHYQAVVLNWLLDAWQFLGVAPETDAGARSFLAEYIERMIPATAMLCERGTRLLSVIGDVSPDLAPAQSLSRLRLLYPRFWPPGAPSETTSMRDGWFRMDAGQSIILGNFPAGSFPADFPTHGHADFTSFAWLHGGTEVLVDRGRCRYSADATSAFQKRASGHNVPLVNGFAPLCESPIPAGQWWPLPYAAARLEAAVSGSEVMLAHDGFARATPVIRHCRRLRLDGDALTVLDSFAGEGDVELGFCWHFGEAFDSFDAQQLTVSGGAASLAMNVEGLSGPPRVAVAGAGEGGWMSRAYGQLEPALAVYLSWRTRLPAQVCTRFRLRPSDR